MKLLYLQCVNKEKNAVMSVILYAIIPRIQRLETRSNRKPAEYLMLNILLFWRAVVCGEYTQVIKVTSCL